MIFIKKSYKNGLSFKILLDNFMIPQYLNRKINKQELNNFLKRKKEFLE